MTEPPYEAGAAYPPYPPPAYPPPAFPPPPYAPPTAPPTPPPSPPPAPGNDRRVVALSIAAVAAVVLVLTAAVVPVLVSRALEDPVDRDLSAVRTYRDLDPSHVRLGEDVDYPQSPPVGGHHWPVWIECGVYTEELPVESAVHDLEHGTVWVTYRPGKVDRAGVDRLAQLLPANGLLSPYPDQEAPVAITVWGRQLALTGPDDPRIPLFIGTYGAGTTAPEPFASCHGGLDPAELTGPEASRPATPDRDQELTS